MTFLPPRRFLKTALMAAAFTLTGTSAVSAQLPEEFTNLEVLPEDIDQRTLINYMRSFAIGLGVRCTFCHVGEEGQPLSTYDFAADDKETKLRARVMLRMVQAINEDHLTEIENHDESTEVTCATCHRGLSTPRMLEDQLALTYNEAGIDSTVAQYRSIREQYYGTYSYDFTESVLNTLAGTVSNASNDTALDDAMTVLQLNQEFFPRSAQIHFLMGEVNMGQDDTEAAIEHYRAALEIFPNFRPAQQRLNQLGG